MPPPWEPAAKPARSHGGLEAFGSHTSHSLDGGIAYKPLTRGWVPFTRSGWVLFTLSKRLGVSVKEDTLREQFTKAREAPGAQNAFRRLRLNEWTEQHERWIDISVWDELNAPVVREELAGRICFAGLDLSSTTDVSAFVLLFPPEPGGDSTWQLLCRFWIPGDNIQKRVERDRVPNVWVREGLIEATEGNVIDYDVIHERIREDAETFRIREIAFDRWNATQLCTQLMSDGFEMVSFGQGFASMAAPTRELENLIVGRQLAHGGNPVMRWMFSNVAVKQDAAGNLKPDKGKATERIDGVVALVMAVGRAMVREESQPSYRVTII